MLSVSTTDGLTDSALIPRTSAACIAIDALDPPMSVEPSVKITVPSIFNERFTADFSPILNQYPLAIPLPLSFPFPNFFSNFEFQ